MRILIAILISFASTALYASQANPTREELRQTIEHIVALANVEQAKLDAANKLNADLGAQLKAAQVALAAEQKHAAALQTQIDAQAAALANAQAEVVKDKATIAKDDAVIAKAAKRNSLLSLILSALAAIAVCFLFFALKLQDVLSFSSAVIAAIGFPGAVGGVIFFVLKHL